MSHDAASAATSLTQSTPDTPPPAPNPSKDPQLAAVDPKPSPDADDAAARHDLAKLKPADALRLLAASVELLVRLTGDIPPTPPPKTPTDPQMSGITAEKAHIARSYSERSLARLRQQADAQPEPAPTSGDQVGATNLQAYSAAMAAKLIAQQAALSPGKSSGPRPEAIDGVRLKDASPPAQPDSPYLVIGADSQPVNMQHGAITRKFYSKKEPPISVQQYLQRLHQFCPMSTAVYLATSLYIHRLAVDERAIPVTRRNAHRLVLAGLRVAMKALEDLSYPHGKIAKVGGVSEVELARLEISFCFLAGFDLMVREEDLRQHWEALRDGRAQQILTGMEVPTLKLGRRPREIPTPGVET